MDPLEAFMAGINQQADSQKAEAAKKQAAIDASAAEEAVDPLEAFMAGISAELSSSSRKKKNSGGFVPQRMDMDDDGLDEMQAQLAAQRESGGRLSANATAKEMKRAEKEAERAAAGKRGKTHRGNLATFDDDGNPVAPTDAMMKEVPILAPLDHSAIAYEPFEKAFYTPHADVVAMTDEAVADFRRGNTVKITGGPAGAARTRPIAAFSQAGFAPLLMARIKAVGYTAPTPIQCQVRSHSAPTNRCQRHRAPLPSFQPLLQLHNYMCSVDLASSRVLCSAAHWLPPPPPCRVSTKPPY